MAGIEPGPPVQQASALSITPLPLGLKAVDDYLQFLTHLRKQLPVGAEEKGGEDHGLVGLHRAAVAIGQAGLGKVAPVGVN